MKLNSNEIQNIIPHRYPFLLVDKIIDSTENTIKGIKNVSANEMQFVGHFPNKHVMPGVLIVEALAQTGCVLLLSKEENIGKIAYFAGMDKVRFKKQVLPGDVLLLDVEFTKQRAGIFFAKARAFVENVEVVSAEIMCAIN